MRSADSKYLLYTHKCIYIYMQTYMIYCTLYDGYNNNNIWNEILFKSKYDTPNKLGSLKQAALKVTSEAYMYIYILYNINVYVYRRSLEVWTVKI